MIFFLWLQHNQTRIKAAVAQLEGWNWCSKGWWFEILAPTVYMLKYPWHLTRKHLAWQQPSIGMNVWVNGWMRDHINHNTLFTGCCCPPIPGGQQCTVLESLGDLWPPSPTEASREAMGTIFNCCLIEQKVHWVGWSCIAIFFSKISFKVPNYLPLTRAHSTAEMSSWQLTSNLHNFSITSFIYNCSDLRKISST